MAGKLHHVASNNASELLGEYLVRRGVISRDGARLRARGPAPLRRPHGRHAHLPRPRAVARHLPRHPRPGPRPPGRPVQWRTGTLTFYADQTAPHVEFPLDLELPALILAGVEAASQPRRRGEAGATAWTTWSRPRLPRARRVLAAPWPPLAAARARLRDGAAPRARDASPPSPPTRRHRRATPSGRSTSYRREAHARD